MTIFSEKQPFDTALAEELAVMANQNGWAVVLNEMLCHFGTEIQTDIADDGTLIIYTDLDEQPVDIMVPTSAEAATTIQVGGKYTLHTITLNWTEYWDDELSFARSLTLVNDTLRMEEDQIDNGHHHRQAYARRMSARRRSY